MYEPVNSDVPFLTRGVKRLFSQGHNRKYRGADKSLARPERKQARKHVRDARDFKNIELRAVIRSFFPARHGDEGNSRYSDRNISLVPSWSGYGLTSTSVSNGSRAAQHNTTGRVTLTSLYKPFFFLKREFRDAFF